MATLTFTGAAQEVTGSCHLLHSPAIGRVLLDCGMHQGGDTTDRLLQEHFAFEPTAIDAVIISHAHIDHSGLLPKLVHDGFDGPIYCTEASAELLDIMLHDSVGLYQRDLERANLRLERRGKPLQHAAYGLGDVEKALGLCQGQPYNKSFELAAGARVCFRDAGHILGSAIVEVSLQEKGQSKTLVYSGDLGKNGSVLMNDHTLMKHADLVVMEGTYGDRDHRELGDTVDQFETILAETWQAGGNVMIPAFAVGRTQEVLYYLGQLHAQGKLDNWQVILDSPMATKVTQLYDRWFHALSGRDVRKLRDEQQTLLKNFLPKLHISMTPEDSMAINRIRKGAIIIAGSGMCTGGRIRHHFKQRIWQKRNTLLFTGFQARGTLGRMLVDGMKQVKLFGEEYCVRARVETLGGFSAHAGQRELIEWACAFEDEPRLVLVHGEAQALDALSQKLWDDKRIKTEIPGIGQTLAF